ncbi:PKAR [Symbiodinium sp. CCMP2592]|nr:PKAR [Symbiodinium sp. CCMP2592]
MPPEGIARIADTLQKRTYQPKEDIIRQHEEGKEFFIMLSGVARVWVRTGNDEQEYKRYKAGDLFGELALLKNAPRAAFVSAVTSVEVLALTRKQFERLFGPMTDLQQQQYLTDPRKLIADFYMAGDARGPRGSLKLHQLAPDAKAHGESTWPSAQLSGFAVYRPTSKDAIAKMLSGVAVGKGLNVKGKSAKKGVLSGFVPFIQISDNDHRSIIEQSPRESRVTVYYKTKASRQEAQKLLQAALEDTSLDIEDRSLRLVDDFQPESWGLDLPEPLIREMYIVRSDLTPVMGWETGRRSEPAFMDMNLHAIRGKSEPQVVLYQYDESDPMNPRGLLIAYAEAHVKPVVSDFDTFTVGSRGMRYSQLPADQAKLITWLLQRTQEILGSLDHNPWTSRWLEVLKKENEKEDGVHPELPKFGFGDPTSYQLIADVVAETAPCGAVRHGAECSNFYFPQAGLPRAAAGRALPAELQSAFATRRSQELDDEFLVVWHGFNEMHGKPWDYKDESSLRAFLLERIAEGYSFPLNPVWPLRDKGWFEVFQVRRPSVLVPSRGEEEM